MLIFHRAAKLCRHCWWGSVAKTLLELICSASKRKWAVIHIKHQQVQIKWTQGGSSSEICAGPRWGRCVWHGVSQMALLDVPILIRPWAMSTAGKRQLKQPPTGRLQNPLTGSASGDKPKGTNRAQNAVFADFSPILADSRLLLENEAFGKRRVSQKTADFRRRPQKTAGTRRRPQMHEPVALVRSILSPSGTKGWVDWLADGDIRRGLQKPRRRGYSTAPFSLFSNFQARQQQSRSSKHPKGSLVNPGGRRLGHW